MKEIQGGVIKLLEFDGLISLVLYDEEIEQD
jgi:hypothetical protein